MIDWLAALILLGVFVLIVAITRYVSLGSMISAVLLPAAAAILGRGTANMIFSVLIAILVVYMHRSNIKRLLAGTESKLGAKKPEVQSNVKDS
jgi:glycerol-3-phosphate acyltransferase PlsY